MSDISDLINVRRLNEIVSILLIDISIRLLVTDKILLRLIKEIGTDVLWNGRLPAHSTHRLVSLLALWRQSSGARSLIPSSILTRSVSVPLPIPISIIPLTLIPVMAVAAVVVAALLILIILIVILPFLLALTATALLVLLVVLLVLGVI